MGPLNNFFSRALAHSPQSKTKPIRDLSNHLSDFGIVEHLLYRKECTEALDKWIQIWEQLTISGRNMNWNRVLWHLKDQYFIRVWYTKFFLISCEVFANSVFSVMRRYRTRVSHSVRHTVEPSWLMCPWWVKIPTEDFTDETLAIDDTLGDNVRGGDWGDGHGCWQGGRWGDRHGSCVGDWHEMI